VDTEKPPSRLPVIATAIEAMKLPLTHWREFLRFGWIAMGAIFLRQLALQIPSSDNPQISPVRAVLGILLMLASAVAAIPFQVAWIRLSLNGRGSIANRPIWIFSHVEIKFTLGCLVLALIMAGPFAIALVLAWLLRNIMPLMVLSLIASAGLLIAGIGCTIRLWFVLIELAAQRYRGASAAWNQSRGIVWRLSALSLIVPLLYLIGAAICEAFQVRTLTYAGWIMCAILGSVFSGLASASVIGGLTLAYKLTASESAMAAVALD
jgi:hypothetical protein